MNISGTEVQVIGKTSYQLGAKWRPIWLLGTPGVCKERS